MARLVPHDSANGTVRLQELKYLGSLSDEL